MCCWGSSRAVAAHTDADGFVRPHPLTAAGRCVSEGLDLKSRLMGDLQRHRCLLQNTNERKCIEMLRGAHLLLATQPTATPHSHAVV